MYTQIIGEVMKLKHYYMAEPQIKAIEKLAKEKGMSVSELIRRAIDLYLETESKK